MNCARRKSFLFSKAAGSRAFVDIATSNGEVMEKSGNILLWTLFGVGWRKIKELKGSHVAKAFL